MRAILKLSLPPAYFSLAVYRLSPSLSLSNFSSDQDLGPAFSALTKFVLLLSSLTKPLQVCCRPSLILLVSILTMTKSSDSSSSSKSVMAEPRSPYYLTGQHLPRAALTTIRLKGDNYIQWEQASLLAFRSQNRLGFINEAIKEPTPDSTDYIMHGIW